MAVNWSEKTVAELKTEVDKRVDACSEKSRELYLAIRNEDPDVNAKISAHRNAASAVCRIAAHAVAKASEMELLYKRECGFEEGARKRSEYWKEHADADQAKLKQIRLILDCKD